MDRGGFILSWGVTHASEGKWKALPPLLEQLPIQPILIAADTAYSAGRLRDLMGHTGVTAYIPTHVGKATMRFPKQRLSQVHPPCSGDPDVLVALGVEGPAEGGLIVGPSGRGFCLLEGGIQVPVLADLLPGVDEGAASVLGFLDLPGFLEVDSVPLVFGVATEVPGFVPVPLPVGKLFSWLIRPSGSDSMIRACSSKDIPSVSCRDRWCSTPSESWYMPVGVVKPK